MTGVQTCALPIYEGRHSFAGSESISKRDQDLNEFLKRNLEKHADLKLKGVSNDKVSTVYYSTKPETSSPYSKPTSEEEDDDKSVCPSERDFPPIDASGYIKQLRVLTVLNEDFKVDLTPCCNNIKSVKTNNSTDKSNSKS